MIILHYSTHLKSGGPAAQAADLAAALQAEGCENIVLSPPCELVSRLHLAGAKHISCRRPNIINFINEIRRLRNIIRSKRPQFVQVYTAEAAWIAGMACKRVPRRERPTIVGVLSSYPRLGLSLKGWQQCDVFTAISKHLRTILKEDSSSLKCTPWVIPYGADERLCYPGYTPTAGWLEQWQRNHPEAANKLTICVPGAISSLHGLDDLVPILTGLLRTGISAHVYLVGDSRRGNTAYVEELKRKFAQAYLSEHISWLGVRSDLRDILSICDVTLSLTKEPATWDRPVLEALSLGRPVVGYDHGIIGELLEAFLPEGRVAPNDTAAVIDTLTQWHTYRPSSLQEIPYPYKQSDMAKVYLKLYNELKQKS